MSGAPSSAGSTSTAGRAGAVSTGSAGSPASAGSRGGGGSSSISTGCSADPKPSGDLKFNVQDGRAVTRSIDLLVPASYNARVPRAVSIVYHGAGGNALDGRGYGLQDAPGASEVALFPFPQGIPYENFGVGWDDRCSGYDMKLFDNLLAYLQTNYCIDTSRVFVTGFSWGCDQVTALACCRGDRIRGIAAASCSDEFSDPANASSYQNLPCPVTPGAGIRFTHDSIGDQGYASPLFATTLSLYRSFNRCSATATPNATASPCRSFDGCAKPLVDCPYDGLGHALPANFGRDTWAFFTSL